MTEMVKKTIETYLPMFQKENIHIRRQKNLNQTQNIRLIKEIHQKLRDEAIERRINIRQLTEIILELGLKENNSKNKVPTKELKSDK